MSDKETLGTFGPFEIRKELTSGSRTRVVKAVQPPSTRHLAVKILPREAGEDEAWVERFEQDAESLRGVNDPNVVLVLEGGVEEGQPYLAMEYVPLERLSKVLRRRRLSLQQALAVFKEICRGLKALHGAKVVHRNLNPASVLVSDDLTMVKVAGLGSVGVVDLPSEMETLATGRLNVAMHYVSPEQVAGGDADQRSDIYSAGVILYEMLTGRIPLGRVGLPSRVNSAVPAEVDRLVLRCISSEPGNRYQTVGQVLGALGVLEDRLRLGVVNELKGIMGAFKEGRSRVGWIAAAVVVLLLAVGAWWFLGRSGGQQEVAPPTAQEEVPSGGAPTEETARAAPVHDPKAGEEQTEALDGEAESPPPDRPVAQNPVSVPAETPADAAEDLRVAREKLESGLEEQALADLEALTRDHPDSPSALDAYLEMARIHTSGGRADEALAAVVEADTRFAGRSGSAEARYRRAQLVMEVQGRAGVEDARDLFARVTADYPQSQWAPRSLSEKAALEERLDLKQQDEVLSTEVPAALITRRQLVQAYPRAAEAEAAYWSLGEMYRDLKRFDLAAGAFSELGSVYPESSHEAWWQAGQLFDKRLDDAPAAVAAYSRVPESSKHYKAARKRIKKLSD